VTSESCETSFGKVSTSSGAVVAPPSSTGWMSRVFAFSIDEYLNYATVNRREWEAKGADIINSNMGLPTL
jgi:hypothetical protein